MADKLIVYKNRTNIITVSLGYSVAGQTVTSEIRTVSNVLIATWTVAFAGDGSDGELILTLDNSVTANIAYASGLMDLKRVAGVEPFAVFERPLEVEFRTAVTA